MTTFATKDGFSGIDNSQTLKQRPAVKNDWPLKYHMKTKYMSPFRGEPLIPMSFFNPYAAGG